MYFTGSRKATEKRCTKTAKKTARKDGQEGGLVSHRYILDRSTTRSVGSQIVHVPLLLASLLFAASASRAATSPSESVNPPSGSRGVIQDIELIETPTLRITSPPVIRVGGLEENATSVWQSHDRSNASELRVVVGAHNGFYGKVIELIFSVDGDQIRDVRVSETWSTDVGPPFEGVVQDFRGRVVVSTKDLSEHDHLDIAFSLTRALEGTEVTVSGEASVDLRTTSAEVHFEQEYFGSSVALEGDLAAISSVNATHVSERSDGSWTLRHVLPVAGEVAISGGTLAILTSDPATVPSSISFYDTRDLRQTAVLYVPSDGADEFHSRSMALDEANLLVGQLSYEKGRGRVLVYRRNEEGWELTQRISCPDSEDDYFGASVALSGDLALVGRLVEVPGFDWKGDAFVFEQRNRSWVHTGTLPRSARPLDKYGHDVALVDGAAIVGAPHDPGFGDCTGSAYLYDRTGGSWQAPERFPGADSRDFFGWVVKADDGWGDGPVLVAASGKNQVLVFTRDGVDWEASAPIRLQLPEGTLDLSEFGETVAISGKTILVGAPQYPARPEKPRTGAVFVYDLVEGVWRLTGQLVPTR